MVLDDNHYEDLIEREAHAKEVYFKRKAEIDEYLLKTPSSKNQEFYKSNKIKNRQVQPIQNHHQLTVL